MHDGLYVRMSVQKNDVILAHPSPQMHFGLVVELKGQQWPQGGQQTVVCLSFPGGSRNV